MELREIKAEEADKLYHCLAALSEYHNEVSINFKGSYPTHDYLDTLERFKQQLASGVSHIAVIETEEGICGFCKVDFDKTAGKLDYLVVLEEQRGNGYGCLLMDWAMQTFRSNHVRSVEVKVIDGNPAVHLYEKYGFGMNAHILRCNL